MPDLTESSPFGLLKASLLKLRPHHRHPASPPPPSANQTVFENLRAQRLRSASVDSSKSHLPCNHGGPRDRRASVPASTPISTASLAPDYTAQQIHSLVQEISDGTDRYPASPRKRRRPSNTIQTPSHPSLAAPPQTELQRPDPKLILEALKAVPRLGRAVQERLDLHEQMMVYQLDQMDAEERNAVRCVIAHAAVGSEPSSLLSSSSLVSSTSEIPSSTFMRSSTSSNTPSALAVFGTPLRKLTIYASTSTLLASRPLELPIVVVSCVEELYRTGLYQPSLFRTLPNPQRLRELVDAFNSERVPDGVILTPRPMAAKRKLGMRWGEHISLHLEATADICAVTSTFLMALPEPVFPPGLFEPMWEWCGVEEVNDVVEEVKGLPVDGRYVPHAVETSRPRMSEREKVLVAQLLLHLLPAPNCDLLVYLMAFFSQVALVEKENGLGVKDLGAMFGESLFGGERNGFGGGTGAGGEARGAKMMSWLLKRWGLISHHLFDAPYQHHRYHGHSSSTSSRSRSQAPPSPLSSAVSAGTHTPMSPFELVDSDPRETGLALRSPVDPSSATSMISHMSRFTYDKASVNRRPLSPAPGATSMYANASPDQASAHQAPPAPSAVRSSNTPAVKDMGELDKVDECPRAHGESITLLPSASSLLSQHRFLKRCQ